MKKAEEETKLHEVLSISIVTRSPVTVCHPKKAEVFLKRLSRDTSSWKILHSH